MKKKYIVAGIVIMVLGIISVVNAFIHNNVSEVFLGIGFVIIGSLYLMKKGQ